MTEIYNCLVVFRSTAWVNKLNHIPVMTITEEEPDLSVHMLSV